MNESGEKLDAAYRGLAREEPRAAIDDAILAASRRALAKPSLSRRWAAPASIAAVLVLAFGITLHMREESPGIESPNLDASRPRATGSITPAPEAAKPAEPSPDRQVASALPPKVAGPAAPAPGKKLKAPAKPDREEPRAMEERERGVRDEARPAPGRKDMRNETANIAQPSLQKESDLKQAPMPQAIAPAAPAARMQAAPSSTSGASAAPPPEVYSAQRPATAAAAPAPEQPTAGAMRLKRETAATGLRSSTADVAVDELTRDLEAIAKLRAEGRNEEADKALDEFRRKHPGYRIPDAMWERVKPR